MTTCFVIGPIGEEHAPLGSPARVIWESSLEIYEGVIQAACTFLGIDAVRADQISISGDITDQIFRRLYESDIVIADITGANANVMYELGLRHSLNKLTIQVADGSTALPFDVKAIRTIMINRTQFGLIDARKKLTAAIEQGLQGAPEPVAATRVWEALRNGTATDMSPILGPESLKGVPSIDDDDSDGYLELMAKLNTAFEPLSATTEEIAACIVTIGEETESARREMNSVPDSASPSVKLTLLRKFADTLNVRGGDFDRLTNSFEQDLRELDAQVSPLLELIATNEYLRSTDDVPEFLDAISSLAENAREGMSGLGSFAASVRGIGAMTKILRAPGNTIVRAVARMSNAASLLDNWDVAAQRIRELQQD